MRLFERINNKITEEKRKQKDNSYLFDDDKDSVKNNKKSKIESGRTTYNKNKQLNKEIGQRVTAQDRQQQIFSRQYDAYDDGDLGNPSQSKTQTTTQKTSTKNRPLRKGVDYFFDAEKAKKAKDEFRKGRKAYTDSTSGIKAGKVTDKGVIDYITKARNMKQGTNANTKANREAAKVIAKSSGSEYKEKIRTKYETDKDLSRKRPSNAKSLEQIKREIDSRPPDGRTSKTKTKVKTPSYKKIETKVTNKEIQDLIKKGQEAIPKKSTKVTAAKIGNVDKAIKGLDDLLIGAKPGEVEKTKKLLRKQQRIVTKKITTPSAAEIEKSQKIIDKNKPKTSTQNLFDVTGKKKKKLKTQQVNFDKFMNKLKTQYPKPKLSLYDPLKTKIPNLEPLKPLRTFVKPSVVTKTATKTKLFPKVMKALRKNPKTALAVGLLGLGAYGSIKNRNKVKTMNNNKILPSVSGSGNIETTKPIDLKLFYQPDSSRK